MSKERLPVCPVCSQHLCIRLATGRKSGKAFVMLICSKDGRHFRAFISDRSYVGRVIEHLEAHRDLGA
ncbi:MAG: hypothetical protein DRI40_08110 [Chloroflexi bacterium]|nr:MAG: hypothetical protein DRI40_08110 [Chloroflexota bacterium]